MLLPFIKSVTDLFWTWISRILLYCWRFFEFINSHFFPRRNHSSRRYVCFFLYHKSCHRFLFAPSGHKDMAILITLWRCLMLLHYHLILLVVFQVWVLSFHRCPENHSITTLRWRISIDDLSHWSWGLRNWHLASFHASTVEATESLWFDKTRLLELFLAISMRWGTNWLKLSAFEFGDIVGRF